MAKQEDIFKSAEEFLKLGAAGQAIKSIDSLTSSMSRLRSVAYETGRGISFSSDAIGRGTITMENFGAATDNAIKKVLLWQVAIEAVYGIRRRITDMIQTWKDLELTLSRISITTGALGDELYSYFQKVSDIAIEFGMPIDQTLKGMDLALRATAKLTDAAEREATAIKLLRDTSILANLTGMQYSQSIDIMVGSLRQMGMNLDQGGRLLDKWVRVSKNAAVSVNDLAQGFAIMADAAQAAGMTVDQVNGVIAALSETVTLGPVEVGNAIRALMSTLYNTESVTLLQRFGVAVKNSAGEARSFWDIMSQLSAMRMTGVLSESEWLSLARAAGGGARRYAQFLAVLKNWDTAMRVSALSADAWGDAQAANEKIVDTLANSWDKFTAAQRNYYMAYGARTGLIENLSDVLKGLTKAVQALAKAPQVFYDMARAITYLSGVLLGSGIIKYLTRWTGMGPKLAGMISPFAGVAPSMVMGTKGWATSPISDVYNKQVQNILNMSKARFAKDVKKLFETAKETGTPISQAKLLALQTAMMSQTQAQLLDMQKVYGFKSAGEIFKQSGKALFTQVKSFSSNLMATGPALLALKKLGKIPAGFEYIAAKGAWQPISPYGGQVIGGATYNAAAQRWMGRTPSGRMGFVPTPTPTISPSFMGLPIGPTKEMANEIKGLRQSWEDLKKWSMRGRGWGMGSMMWGGAAGAAAYGLTKDKWAGVGSAIAGYIGFALKGPIGLGIGAVIGTGIAKVIEEITKSQETRLKEAIVSTGKYLGIPSGVVARAEAMVDINKEILEQTKKRMELPLERMYRSQYTVTRGGRELITAPIPEYMKSQEAFERGGKFVEEYYTKLRQQGLVTQERYNSVMEDNIVIWDELMDEEIGGMKLLMLLDHWQDVYNAGLKEGISAEEMMKDAWYTKWQGNKDLLNTWKLQIEEYNALNFTQNRYAQQQRDINKIYEDTEKAIEGVSIKQREMNAVDATTIRMQTMSIESGLKEIDAIKGAGIGYATLLYYGRQIPTMYRSIQEAADAATKAQTGISEPTSIFGKIIKFLSGGITLKVPKTKGLTIEDFGISSTLISDIEDQLNKISLDKWFDIAKYQPSLSQTIISNLTDLNDFLVNLDRLPPILDKIITDEEVMAQLKTKGIIPTDFDPANWQHLETLQLILPEVIDNYYKMAESATGTTATVYASAAKQAEGWKTVIDEILYAKEIIPYVTKTLPLAMSKAGRYKFAGQIQVVQSEEFNRWSQAQLDSIRDQIASNEKTAFLLDNSTEVIWTLVDAITGEVQTLHANQVVQDLLRERTEELNDTMSGLEAEYNIPAGYAVPSTFWAKKFVAETTGKYEAGPLSDPTIWATVTSSVAQMEESSRQWKAYVDSLTAKPKETPEEEEEEKEEKPAIDLSATKTEFTSLNDVIKAARDHIAEFDLGAALKDLFAGGTKILEEAYTESVAAYLTEGKFLSTSYDKWIKLPDELKAMTLPFLETIPKNILEKLGPGTIAALPKQTGGAATPTPTPTPTSPTEALKTSSDSAAKSIQNLGNQSDAYATKLSQVKAVDFNDYVTQIDWKVYIPQLDWKTILGKITVVSTEAAGGGGSAVSTELLQAIINWYNEEKRGLYHVPQTFQYGGRVQRTGQYTLHKGEEVVSGPSLLRLVTLFSAAKELLGNISANIKKIPVKPAEPQKLKIEIPKSFTMGLKSYVAGGGTTAAPNQDLLTILNKLFIEYLGQANLPNRQFGGNIPYTGLYRLHAGEYVVPKHVETNNNADIVNKLSAIGSFSTTERLLTNIKQGIGSLHNDLQILNQNISRLKLEGTEFNRVAGGGSTNVGLGFGR